MNVLVILEDFRLDQFVAKPIVEALMAAVGRPRARVRILMDPLLGGVDRALDRQELLPIFERYRGMVDLFLILVDRDGNHGRRATLDAIESWARAHIGDRLLLGENAWQELEVWALAAADDLPKDWVWREIRADRDPKENYFRPYVTARGLTDEPGAGRLTLGRAAGRNYKRVRSLCPEDLGALETRISKMG